MTAGAGTWSLGPHDLARLDQLLRSFLDETKAHCVLLLDRTGHILTTAGDGAGLDRMAIASLAAADFAASGQLAVLLGEEEFTSLYHHGTRRSMYLVDLAGQAILAALFDGRTTLGMVRLKTRNMVPAFASLFAGLASRGPDPGTPLDASWAEEAVGEIDRLFAE